MTRAARLLLWFVVGVALGCSTVVSWAGILPVLTTTPTASPSTLYYVGAAYTGSVDGAKSADPAGACAAASGLLGAGFRLMYPGSGMYCGKEYFNGTAWIGNGSKPITSVAGYLCGSVAQTSSTCAAVASCPAGYTMDSGGTTCSNGCTVGALVSVGYSDCGPTADACRSFPIFSCSVGCEAAYGGGRPSATYLSGGVTRYLAKGAWELTGESCRAGASTTPAATSVPPASSCALGQDMGTVNGLVKCFDRATGQPAQTQAPTTTATTTSQTTDPGSGNTTKTETTTNGDGSQSVTVTVVGSGGQPISSQTTKTPAPTGSAGAVDPNAPPDPKDPCVDNPTRVGCAELGTPADQPDLTTRSIGPNSIMPVSLSGNASCPADLVLPHGVHFSMQPICTGLGWFRPAVLTMAWLGALLIVFYGGKTET